MGETDGTNFHFPAAPVRSEIAAISDALAWRVEEGRFGQQQVRTPWRYLAAGFDAKRRHEKQTPKERGMVPSQDGWDRLRGRRSTRDLELDVIALLPPRLLVDLDRDLLRELGEGGRAVADLSNKEERSRLLRTGETWDRRTWDDEDAADTELYEAWFRLREIYGPSPFSAAEPELPAACVKAVRDFLQREQKLTEEPDPSAGRQSSSSRMAEVGGWLEALEDAAPPDTGLSSLGLTRIKLLRAAIARRSDRWEGERDGLRRELVDLTGDVVYAPASVFEPTDFQDTGHDTSERWLHVLDRLCLEWSLMEGHQIGDERARALEVATWLLPQIIRLGHRQPAPVVVAYENQEKSSWVDSGPRRPSAAALSYLAEAVSADADLRGAVARLLSMARCPVLWHYIASRPEERKRWARLARWAQAAWLRHESANDDIAARIEQVQKETIRLAGALTSGSLPIRLTRWDAYRLDSAVVALEQLVVARSPGAQHTDVPGTAAPSSERVVSFRHTASMPCRPAAPPRAPADAGAVNRARKDRKLAHALSAVWAASDSWRDPREVLKEVAVAAGISHRTVRNRCRESGGCASKQEARLVLELVDLMTPEEKIAAGERILDISEWLKAFYCCEEDHAELLRRYGSSQMRLPPLSEVLHFSTAMKTEWARLRSEHLRRNEPGDRWRDERAWAAMYATESDPELARELLNDAIQSPDDWVSQAPLCVLGSLGRTELLEKVVDVLEETGHKETSGMWLYLADALQSARDSGRSVTADRLRGRLLAVLGRGDVIPADEALTLLSRLGSDAQGGDGISLGEVERVTRTVEPTSQAGIAAREIVTSIGHRQRGDTDRELLALRASWDATSSLSAHVWPQIFAAALVERLVELETKFGEDYRAELVYRRVAHQRTRSWLVDLPPREQERWHKLARQGDELISRDQFVPDDRDQAQHGGLLLPSSALEPLLSALTQLTLQSIADPEGRQACPAAVKALRSGLLARQDALPLRVTARRDCDELWSF